MLPSSCSALVCFGECSYRHHLWALRYCVQQRLLLGGAASTSTCRRKRVVVGALDVHTHYSWQSYWRSSRFAGDCMLTCYGGRVRRAEWDFVVLAAWHRLHYGDGARFGLEMHHPSSSCQPGPWMDGGSGGVAQLQWRLRVRTRGRPLRKRAQLHLVVLSRLR